jgi:hypothetical protein
MTLPTQRTFTSDAELLDAIDAALGRFEDEVAFYMTAEAFEALDELRRLVDTRFPVTDLRSHEPPRTEPLNPDPAPTPRATRAADEDVSNG